MRIRSRTLTRIAAWLAVQAGRLLFATCRKVHCCDDPRTHISYQPPPADKERYILCLWHDSLLMPVFVGRQRPVACLVSRHQDGSYLADALEMIGLITVRGSTSRGGAEAARQLIDEAAGMHLAITPDGPRGPRRELKLGPVFLASQTGRAIVPGAFACRRAWRPSSRWTEMVIPKPFTTIYLLSGEPIKVPPNLSREELNRYRGVVQAAMDRLNEEAVDLAAGRPAADAAAPLNLKRAA